MAASNRMDKIYQAINGYLQRLLRRLVFDRRIDISLNNELALIGRFFYGLNLHKETRNIWHPGQPPVTKKKDHQYIH